MANTAAQKHAWYIAHRDRQRAMHPPALRVKERQPEIPVKRHRKPLTPEQRERQNEASRRYAAKHPRVPNPPGHLTPAQAQALDAAKPPSADMLREQAAFEAVIRTAIESGTVEHGKWYGETQAMLSKFDANPPSFRTGRQAFITPKKDDLISPRV